MPTLDEITAFVTGKPVTTAVIAVLTLAGLALAFLTLRMAWRALAWLFARYVAPRPVEDVLTIVAASIATGASAQGMWLFTGDVLDLPVVLRLLLFAFIEVAVVTSAVRARRNMRENFSAGVDGIAVWALTVLTAVLSSMHPSSFPEKIFRLAAPMVAAWLWERGMAIERRRIRGTGRINWRLTPERLMVRLGLAEVSDRTASDVDAHRRLTRVALAIKKVRALQQAGGSQGKIRAALARLDKAMDQAVEHTGLASDEARQEALLARIDALYSTDALVHRKKVAKWADPTTQEDRERAESALNEVLRFDTAEATQRAIDRTAVTLMELAERKASLVTSDVITDRVTARVTQPVTTEIVPAAPGPETVTSDVTPNVTQHVTVEQVTNDVANEVTFDVTNPDTYDVARSLAAPSHVTLVATPDVTPDVTDDHVADEVTEEAKDASKTQVMRDYWLSEIAEDRYPKVAELAAHAGVHHSLASRKRDEWVAELPWWKRRKADPKKATA